MSWAQRGQPPARRLPTPLRTRLAAYFAHFACVVGRLQQLAEREQRGQPLTADDLAFMNRAVDYRPSTRGCAPPTALAWYAQLSRRGGALGHDPVIADVPTQATDGDGRPLGRVLEIGAGSTHQLVVHLPGHAALLHGVLSSFYERITTDFERLRDGP